MSHDGHVGPDFDRQGPAGDYIDPGTGARIGDLDYSAGWSLSPDGIAISDVDPASPNNPIRMSTRPKASKTDPDDGDEEVILLLLLLS